MKCIIFDIDGTLLDNSHRQHFVQGPKKNWDAYNAAMAGDKRNDPVAALCHMVYACGYVVILCTGREEVYREVTQKSLDDNEIHFRHLFMRKTKDYRADEIVKSEMLDEILSHGFEPVFIVDDRSKVVAMWRARGFTVLQCAPGNF